MKLANVSLDLDTFYDTTVLSVSEKCIPADQNKNMVEVSYKRVLPRVLDFLDHLKVKITFMVIGRDANLFPEMVQEIFERGHEIGNHTQNHFKDFSCLNYVEILKEIEDCQETLAFLTKQRPICFRAPGYTITPEVLIALKKSGILVDISLVNSFPYLLVKALYKYLIVENKNSLHVQSFKDVFSPNIPHPPKGEGPIIFPISNSSFFNLPLITSFLLHFGIDKAKILLNSSLKRSWLNINLHLFEFVDEEDLGFIKSPFFKLGPPLKEILSIGTAERLSFFSYLFGQINQNFQLCPVRNISLKNSGE